MNGGGHIIDVKDYRGIRVIFTHKKWKIKIPHHPELKKQAFLRNAERTIQKPEQVWEDYSDKKNKKCYYRKYSASSYVKVVIWIRDNPCRVVSAFETNKIKEENYHRLKRVL